MRALLWIAAAMCAVPSLAHGNGRPPYTNGVHFRPGDSHSIYVASTFGLLISHDDGCTFDYFCEDDVGYGGIFDPQYAIAADGTIFATTYTGLRVSRDGGCSFQTATDNLAPDDPNRLDVWINALDIGPTGDVWIATADMTKPNGIYRSSDNGSTFTSILGAPATMLWNSVKVAPSNAQRVYAAGYQIAGSAGSGSQSQPVSALMGTTNGGTTWTPSPLAGVVYGGNPELRIIAVDPKNAEIVYLVSQTANPPNGDLVYRSSDGGMTLTQVLATTDPVRDLVIVDDKTVLVAAQSGSFQSGDGGQTFAAMANPPQLQCLGLRGDGALIGCGANWDPDFMAVARSSDHGATWQDVWRFVQIAGPLACPSGTVEHDMCDVQLWPTLREQFGAKGPTCGDNIWPGDPSPPEPKHAGCCDVGGSTPVSLAWAIAVAWWLARRRCWLGRRRRG